MLKLPSDLELMTSVGWIPSSGSSNPRGGLCASPSKPLTPGVVGGEETQLSTADHNPVLNSYN